jgi:hypothetical protein
MEKKINKRADEFFNTFKNDIKKWIETNHINDENKSEFLQFVFDYDKLILTKEDFQKRKRVKNVVPYYERCQALRANGEQCTRRRKQDLQKNVDNELFYFCGTHIKGTPHGKITAESTISHTKKTEVWVQEIKGIHYYLDNNGNVYKPESIMSNMINPQIIAKYKVNKTADGAEYSIPALGL